MNDPAPPRIQISLMLAVDDAPAAALWYARALGATQLWSLGSVIGMSIADAPFFLHETTDYFTSPGRVGATTVRVEVFVDDPDAFLKRALESGAHGTPDSIRDHVVPWGIHRQGSFRDPFGHTWLVGDRSPLRAYPERAHLEPTQSAGRALWQRGLVGPVVMLNLLRFRAVADYSHAPELAPATPISGAEAFDRYVAHTLPYLRASGGELVFLGTGGPLLIGPEAERWDLVMLVRQSSVQSFMQFATDPAYNAGLAHRTAALEDSRLLPLLERPLP